jgi:hypothetical protein
LKILNKIRERAGIHTLRKESAHLSRSKQIININDARSIGIVYFLPEEKVYRTISNYVKQLQDSGKKVKALGYVENKRMTGQFLPKLSYDFIYPNGLSWNYKPTSAAAKDFTETKFDILIDLSNEDLLPLNFVTGLSKAKFKVGLQSKERSKYLDLMIDLKEGDSLDELIKQVHHYLTIINRTDGN